MSRRSRLTRVSAAIDWKAFGAALKVVRIFQKMSQDDVARACSVGHATVCRAESGKRIDAAPFVALCAYMRQNPVNYIVAPKKEAA